MKAEEKIAGWIEEALAEHEGIFLVEAKLKGPHGNQRLTVALDADRGYAVQIDLCADISRMMGRRIEEEELIQGKYNLEVSSAGMGSPLKLNRQYQKNIGRQLSVKTVEGEVLTGILEAVSEKGIQLIEKEETRTLTFTEIDNSTVVVSFK